jgi:hypothetical protein
LINGFHGCLDFSSFRHEGRRASSPWVPGPGLFNLGIWWSFDFSQVHGQLFDAFQIDLVTYLDLVEIPGVLWFTVRVLPPYPSRATVRFWESNALTVAVSLTTSTAMAPGFSPY